MTSVLGERSNQIKQERRDRGKVEEIFLLIKPLITRLREDSKETPPYELVYGIIGDIVQMHKKFFAGDKDAEKNYNDHLINAQKKVGMLPLGLLEYFDGLLHNVTEDRFPGGGQSYRWGRHKESALSEKAKRLPKLPSWGTCNKMLRKDRRKSWRD